MKELKSYTLKGKAVSKADLSLEEGASVETEALKVDGYVGPEDLLKYAEMFPGSFLAQLFAQKSEAEWARAGKLDHAQDVIKFSLKRIEHAYERLVFKVEVGNAPVTVKTKFELKKNVSIPSRRGKPGGSYTDFDHAVENHLEELQDMAICELRVWLNRHQEVPGIEEVAKRIWKEVEAFESQAQKAS